MREGLSFEGLLLQARDVLAARWKALLVVAGGWVTLVVAAERLRMAMTSAVASPDGLAWTVGLPVIMSAPGIIGSAVLMAVIVRIGQPSRPPGEALRHWLMAAVTVLVAIFAPLLLHKALFAMAQLGGLTGEPTPWLTVVSLLSAALAYALFAYFGMMAPAALERPVTPWTAAAVAVKLGEGRRLWLVLIAVAWTFAILAPLLLINVSGLNLAPYMGLIAVGGQMLTAFGTAVLYRELRRLRGAATPATAAETFA